MRLLSANFIAMRLTTFLKKLDNIPNINNGGCGWAAYCIYHFLKQNGRLASDVKVAFLHLSDDPESLKNNLNNPDHIKESSSHVMLYNDGKFIDSTGKYKLSNGILLTEEFCVPKNNIAYGNLDGLVYALTNSRWNSRFDNYDIESIMDQYNIPSPLYSSLT